MSKDTLLEKIRRQAKRDARHRRDRRYLDTIGFLVAKGFLQTNFDVRLLPNQRLRIEDAVWAGRNIEPRILEVLPAAVLRLAAHFDFDANRHPFLTEVLHRLKNHQATGPDFYGIPYEKLRPWVSLTLKDRRIKPLTQKRISKTFRLSPAAVKKLQTLAVKRKCSETEVVELAITAGE